jgi:hypothetical protein
MKKLLPVSMLLGDMIYISYLIPAQRVRPLVPPHISLVISADQNVFVSVVIFRNISVGLGRAAFFPFSYNQLNVRTYCRHPEKGSEGPYFLRCALTSRAMLLSVRLLGYLWEPLQMEIEKHEGPGGRPRQIAKGKLGGEFFVETEELEPTDRDQPQPGSTEDRLVNLFLGVFPARTGPAVLSVDHMHRGMKQARLIRSDLPFLTEMGLVEPEHLARPESLLLFQGADFTIYFPSKSL